MRLIRGKETRKERLKNLNESDKKNILQNYFIIMMLQCSYSLAARHAMKKYS